MKRPETLVLFAALISGCTVLADINGENVVAACTPGEVRACYSGPEGTEGKGICKGGTQVCNAEGKGFGPCAGEVTPAPESCVAQQDDDCDGKTPDPEVECACIPSTEVKCDYTGPEGTEGIGLCVAGHRVCNALGTEYGPCMGETVPSAEKCSPKQDANCNGVSECEGTYVWGKAFGDMSRQNGRGVATDSVGNVVLTGFFGGTVDFKSTQISSNGAEDFFVVKLDASGGNRLWSTSFGASSFDGGTSVAIDSADNVVLTGSFAGTVDFEGKPLSSTQDSQDIFVAKLSASGDPLWIKRFGEADNQEGVSVATDSEGNIVLTGFFDDKIKFGDELLINVGQGRDIFVAKFDANGEPLWSKGFGNEDIKPDDEEKVSVAIDSTGNVVLVGSFAGTIDIDGHLLASNEDKDIFVAKFDATGEYAWSKHFGVLGVQEATSVAIDSTGNIVLAGSFAGTFDFGNSEMTIMSKGAEDVFVTKLDASGNLIWSESFGDLGDQKAASVATDSAGNIVLTGYFGFKIKFGDGPEYNPGTNFRNIFLAKLDPGGVPVWSKGYGYDASKEGKSVATDSAGNVVLTGYFDGLIDFDEIGDGLVHSSGGEDIFVAKFSP